MSSIKNKPTSLDIQEWDEFSSSVKKLDKNIAISHPPQVRRPTSNVYSQNLSVSTKFALALKPNNIIIGNSAGIDKNLAKKMDSGKLQIDAMLDLHGKTLLQSHSAVLNFILNSFELKYRLLLIITGKGIKSQDSRPILKKELPKWLNDERLSHIIIRANFAHQKHGGTGAFYILLKRHR